MRLLLVLLATLGIYISLAGWPAERLQRPPAALTGWTCPPALAATTASMASGDTWVWKDYQDPDTLAEPKTPLWEAAIGVFFKLAFVIALIYAVLYGYKRLLGIRTAGVLGGRIRVVESTRLAGTQSLLLVEANGRYLLLGSNGAGVLIKLMDWPVEQTAPAPEDAAFAHTLAQATRTDARGGMVANLPPARPPAVHRDDFDGVVESSIRQALSQDDPA